MRSVILLVGVVAALVVTVAMFGVDEGEVVGLTTRDAAGATYETQVWIVDDGGTLFLRAGRTEARWLERIRANPAVEIHRGEGVKLYTAVPLDDDATRTRVNELMKAKYGDADRMIARFFDQRHSVPIRLDPREGEVSHVPGPPPHP
jgi:hypothetical protein